MRTTISLDNDVAAMVEQERARSGVSLRAIVNRPMRRGCQSGAAREQVPLPLISGRLVRDVSDTSAVLAELDEERPRERRLP